MPKYNQKGFSLLGVIIAIFIAIIGLMAILNLANISLRGAYSSKMRLIASGLAQEGIEVVRNFRNSNSDWDDWYNAVSDNDYLVQYDSSDLMDFVDIQLRLDTSSGIYGLYQYGIGNDSSFYRKVSLEKISADEVKITVEVKWELKKDQWNSLIVEDRFWNWK